MVNSTRTLFKDSLESLSIHAGQRYDLRDAEYHTIFIAQQTLE
jgi:hypothetical protein